MDRALNEYLVSHACSLLRKLVQNQRLPQKSQRYAQVI